MPKKKRRPVKYKPKKTSQKRVRKKRIADESRQGPTTDEFRPLILAQSTIVSAPADTSEKE